MLVKLAGELPFNASLEEVWKLLRDTPHFSGHLPGVENINSLCEEVEAYSAQVSERIGPFKIRMNLDVRITETQVLSLLKAVIKGADSMCMNRMTGAMQVTLGRAPAGTQIRFEASFEILGKLATLGAVPILRRTMQAFTEFAGNIQKQFASRAN